MTKLFLSSLDVNFRDLSDESIYDCKYLLVTFFYARKAIKDQRFLTAMLRFNSKGHLIVDSGAFSFMNGKDISEKELDQYCREYVSFIKKYHIKYFVEMDIDAVLGYEKALDYRNYIENGVGQRCIPIFHKSRGKQEFIKMVQQYKYAGIGGIAIKNIKPKEFVYFKQLNEFAKYYGCKLHAMGFTPTTNLNSYGFYSSDSSSWCSGVRFGTVYNFNGSAVKQLRRPKGYRLKTSRKSTQNHNWLEWCKYQRYVDRR